MCNDHQHGAHGPEAHAHHAMHHHHGGGEGDHADFPMRGRGRRNRMRFARPGGGGDGPGDGGHGHHGGPPPWAGGGMGRGGGWGGPPWGGGPGGPGRGPKRRRRGETRGALLGLLAEAPMHGYQLIQELESRSEGMWRASPGSVYPTLQLLEDQGLIRGTDDDGRRVFTLTDEGTAAVEELGDAARPWLQHAGGEVPPQFQLVRAAQQLGMAAHQVAHAADADGITKAIEVLEDARRQLYRLLADA